MAKKDDGKRTGKVTNLVSGETENCTQRGHQGGRGGDVTNVINGKATNVVQCGDIIGDVRFD